MSRWPLATRAIKSGQFAFRLTFAAYGQKRLWCRRWRRRAHAHARAAAHAHDPRVPTLYSAHVARCSAAPWAPELAEQRLSAGASGTRGEWRQQVVELGLAERLAAPVSPILVVEGAIVDRLDLRHRDVQACISAATHEPCRLRRGGRLLDRSRLRSLRMLVVAIRDCTRVEGAIVDRLDLRQRRSSRLSRP